MDRIAKEDAKKTEEFSITIKGAPSRDAALSTILDMLTPAAGATLIKMRESLRQDGDDFTLSGSVCWGYDRAYYWCGEGDSCCTYMGPGA